MGAWLEYRFCTLDIEERAIGVSSVDAVAIDLEQPGKARSVPRHEVGVAREEPVAGRHDLGRLGGALPPLSFHQTDLLEIAVEWPDVASAREQANRRHPGRDRADTEPDAVPRGLAQLGGDGDSVVAEGEREMR